MKYLIIGLGIYGANLARDLTEMGHEVIGADNCPTNIEAIKDYISTVYLVDTTEESALSVLPLRAVDLVIVAIGENFGASVKTVALLRKLGINHIYARAIDDLHESILESFGVDRILAPEQRAASDLSHEMAFGSHVQSLEVDPDNVIIKFEAGEYFRDMPYDRLDVLKSLNITLIAATRAVDAHNVLGQPALRQQLLDITNPDQMVRQGDILAVFGSKQNIRRLLRHIS